jgi:uncharacterized membrane protein SpoIIM required for sporulation
MVIENIIRPEWVERNPLYGFILGACISTIGIFLGPMIFPNDASLAGVLLTTIAGLPFLHKIMRIEQQVGSYMAGTESFIKRNAHLMLIYFMFFMGMTASYLIWAIVLPGWMLSLVFSKQFAAFSGGTYTTSLGKFIMGTSVFMAIFMNNMRVLFTLMLLSVIYGAGSMIILVWNASVLGVFITSLFSRAGLLVSSIPHIILEFTGFFLAAVAGGLLSIAFLRVDWHSEQFWQTITDSLYLIVFGIAFIFAGAFVESMLILG